MAVNKEWPSGFQKIDNFLRDLSRNETFLENVMKIRRQFGVPERGYEYVSRKITGKLLFPADLTESEKTNFLAGLDVLAQKHRLGLVGSFTSLLGNFVFYNDWLLSERYDVCAVQDIRRPDDSYNKYGDHLYSDSTHPIAIRISPEATQNDIIDFIRKHHKKDIVPLQILYKKPGTTLGKKKRSRTSEAVEIADFVWSYQSLPRKQIQKEMADQLGTHRDVAEIGKVLSLERKRRNK